MGDITQLIEQAKDGDAAAKETVLARVYAELKHMANKKLTKESTLTQLDVHDLVQEVYLRVMRQAEFPGSSRRVFFAYAAKAMRSVIVDYARSRNAKKHGGNLLKVTLATIPDIPEEPTPEFLQFDALDAALMALEQVNARCHQVVEMRYFAGLSIDEIASVLELSPKTIKRDWIKARTFLYHALKQSS